MHKENITKSVSILVALLTFIGIAVHDTKVDKMAMMAIAIPVVATVYEGAHMLMSRDSHTHVERISIERTALKHTSLLPKLRTRQDEDKMYRLQKGVPRGHHAFDNYNLPVIA